MQAPPPPPALARLRTSARYRFTTRYVLPVLMVLAIGVIAMNNHFDGVDWGDDFALYMHQAKAISIGNVGEVLHENRYAVDNSGWHSFSPYSYPWGWPVLVAPFYVAFGLDYAAFKFLEVVAFCVFLLLFFALVRRRTSPVPAVVLTLLIGLSPAYVRGTDTVLSDLPYLCFVGVTLYWMDRCRRRGFVTASRRDLIVLGLLIAFSFNIRREGVALVVALGAVHLVVLAGLRTRAGSLRAIGEATWRKILLPYGAAAAAVIGWQILLPTVLLPNVPGTGLQNVHDRLTYYQDAISEHLGLKDPGAHMQLFHSTAAAKKVLFLLVIFAVVGLISRLIDRPQEDAALAGYVVATTYIMLVSPYQDQRYLYTITPFVVYFAYQAMPTLAAATGLRNPTALRVIAIAPAVALAGLLLLNAGDLRRATDYHRAYHFTVNGPETASAQEMFAAVRDKTRGDDVILFFRARAMSFYTERLALQGADLDTMLKRVDWYAMEKNSSYSQTPLTAEEGAARGLTKVWENQGWVLWRVPARA